MASSAAAAPPVAAGIHGHPLPTSSPLSAASSTSSSVSSSSPTAASFQSHQHAPPQPLVIRGIPLTGAKSRVETQVKLTLSLPSPPTAGLGAYTHVRLPKGAATKRKSRKQSLADSSSTAAGGGEASEEPALDPKELKLETEVYCATEGVPDGSPKGTLGQRVLACASCRTRELKRSQRKMAVKVKGKASSRSDDEDDTPAAAAGKKGVVVPSTQTTTAQQQADEAHKIVLFNCAGVLEASAKGEVQLPARVTCYCRHHREKLGFLIKFTLLDHVGRPIAVGFTPPLMITDDHKSSEKSTEAAAKAAAAAAAAVGLPAPQHVSGSPAGGARGGGGPKALIMPSNPQPSSGNAAVAAAAAAKKAALAAARSSVGASSTSSLSSSSSTAPPSVTALGGHRAPPSTAGGSSYPSTVVSSTTTSRTHTHGTTSPSFTPGQATTAASSAAHTAVGTPLPAVLPLPRGTKRAAAPSRGEGSNLTGDEDSFSSSSTSSDTTHHTHHHHRKRTTTTSSATPYDRRSSPAGSSLSGASSVLGTPHFPTFALGPMTSLPQMEGADDEEDGDGFGFALDGRISAGLNDGAGGGPHSLRGVDKVAVGDDDGSFRPYAFDFDGVPPADASTATADGEVEAMLFDSLVDYEGGSAASASGGNNASGFGADASMDDLTFSPPASTSSSRRETSAWSATSSSDSDSLLGPSTLLSGGLDRSGRHHHHMHQATQHSHWPSIYPSTIDDPAHHMTIPYPHPYLLPSAPPPPPLPRPSISRLIPAEGALAGGYEVTLLGVNFVQGMQAFFGENQATMTSCWNDGTVVCTVPAGIVAGPVPVVLRMEGRAVEGDNNIAGSNPAGSQLFTYKDASDRALLELALQVVGLKMTGRIEDAKNVALRILGQGSFATNVPTSSNGSPAAGGAQDAGQSAPSEKTTLQRLQSTYQQSVISMTGKSQYQLPPLAVSTNPSAADEKKSVARAELAQQQQQKTKQPSWAAATAAQARRLTEREIARYGHHQTRKGSKSKYDKMLWFFWLPVLICFAVFFAITHLPSLVGDAKRVGGKYLVPFRGLLA